MIRVLRSTNARLALAVASSFLLAFALLGAGVYYAVSRLLDSDARELVRADAAGLLQQYREEGRAALLAEVEDRVDAADDPDAVYAVVSANGRILAGTFARLPPLASRWMQLDEHQAGSRQRVIANVQRLPDGERLLTGTRTRPQDRFLQLMLHTALAALLVAAALGALLGWITSLWVARRLHSIDDTAARVGDGQLGLRAALDGSDDAFDRMARRFNGMLERIEELLDGVRHATDHIAHDLRTPLTRLRNRLEDLRARADHGNALPALDAAIAETDQLLQSFGALLRLARIEAQPPASDEPELELAALVRDAMELYLPSAGERGIVLEGELVPCRVRGDADQLFQLLVNLLDNAIKFAPAGSDVGLQLHPERAMALLEVRDRGPGIPENERERVFDRFQRLEPHRGSPGTGLGMSLVRAIIRRHGGMVSLHDNAPGLHVRVLLPLANTDT